MAFPIFAIFEQVHPKSMKPFKILETTESSDGPRTRVCDGAWEYFEHARVALTAKNHKADAERSARERASPGTREITTNTTLLPPQPTLQCDFKPCSYPQCPSLCPGRLRLSRIPTPAPDPTPHA